MLFGVYFPLQITEDELEILFFSSWMFYTWKSELMNFCGQKSLVRLLDSQAFFTGYLFLLIDMTVLMGSIDMYPNEISSRAF